MMNCDEKKAYDLTMQQLSSMLASQTSLFRYITNDHMSDGSNFAYFSTPQSITIDQIKKLADLYYTLSKAGLYREIDATKLTPEMLDQLR